MLESQHSFSLLTSPSAKGDNIHNDSIFNSEKSSNSSLTSLPSSEFQPVKGNKGKFHSTTLSQADTECSKDLETTFCSSISSKNELKENTKDLRLPTLSLKSLRDLDQKWPKILEQLVPEEEYQSPKIDIAELSSKLDSSLLTKKSKQDA